MIEIFSFSLTALQHDDSEPVLQFLALSTFVGPLQVLVTWPAATSRTGYSNPH